MQRKPFIALVTYAGEPNLTEDDQLLRRAIEQLGGTATTLCWNDPSIDWQAADLTVVRSTWDYIFHLEAFRSWIERVSTQTILVNERELLLWNVDKRYLLDLQAKGVRIVPSLLVEDERVSEDALKSALSRFDGSIVIKPTVSCGSHLARHFAVTTVQSYADAFAHLKIVLRHSAALIQPLLAEVFSRGEESLVFLGGAYSHTAPKEPFREGLSPTYPSRALVSNPLDIRFCETALLTLPVVPLFARIDIIEHNGLSMINEMELVEPELHFHLKENSAMQLAGALFDRCRGGDG